MNGCRPLHNPMVVFVEKEALAGVVYRTTAQWNVPLMVTRGYPSLSFLYSAAEMIAAKVCPTFIYYFGDYDPSGAAGKGASRDRFDGK